MEEGVSPFLSRNGFSFSCELGFSGSLSESVSFFGGSYFPDARDYFFFGGSRVPYLTGDGVFVPKWSDVAPFADPQETASEGVFSAGSKVGSRALFSCICSGLEELDIHFTSVDPVPCTRGLECLGGRNKTDRVTETFLWVSDLAFGDFPEPEPVDCGGSLMRIKAQRIRDAGASRRLIRNSILIMENSDSGGCETLETPNIFLFPSVLSFITILIWSCFILERFIIQIKVEVALFNLESVFC